MKSQMKFQKILSLVSLIFAALTLVYSFSFNSGMLFDVQAYAVPQYEVAGASELVDYAKKVNNIMVVMSIVLIICAVLIYLTQTNKRRNYYITNYVAIGILTIYAVACSITFIVLIAHTFTLCSQVDTDAWLAYVNAAVYNPQGHSFSKVSLILGIVVAVLMLVLVAVWIFNTVLKIMLMRGENQLLKKSAPVSDAEVKEVVNE